MTKSNSLSPAYDGGSDFIGDTPEAYAQIMADFDVAVEAIKSGDQFVLVVIHAKDHETLTPQTKATSIGSMSTVAGWEAVHAIVHADMDRLLKSASDLTVEDEAASAPAPSDNLTSYDL
jgi:hypothetical protein